MKKLAFFVLSILFISVTAFAQDAPKKRQKGHTNKSKFRQLTDELPTPNSQRTASGAPGYEYTQQQVDYVMDIRIDEDKHRLYGNEKITYHNNSKDHLEYLWVQLDQNMRAPDSKTPLVRSESLGNTAFNGPITFTKNNLKKPKDYGYTIEAVTFENGQPLSHMINRTMMRINLPKPLAPGDVFKFNIKWNYLINNHIEDGGRSGYEYFPKDGNSTFVIAQFYPRLCVYDNVEGWQNRQFWGRSEFALEFGDFDVKITVPSDHLVEATGDLQNERDVLTRTQRKRMDQARKSYKDPVFIVTQEEAEAAEKKRSKKNKTWHYKAKNVRDYAFATSRKFLWDAMAVKIGGKNIMAMSLYSKEGNPLWEEHSTRVVANTLEEYSKLTFDYPYSKAVSVHAQMGMEYPMICFNYGRPNPDGTYSARLKRGMIGVITHEVGHNFFPMIVNSDERQWTWMDEGLNSFVEILAELDYDPNFFTGNLPKDIVGYMGGDQSNLSPIMTQGEAVKQFGPNAYTKPAAGLYMLRQTIMGPELFDYAFRTYARRWMFKHPTPADFFRTMEDASAMNLDWFWRGWFYTTDYTDIGVKEVKQFHLTDKPTEKAKKLAKRYNMDLNQYVNKLIYFEEGVGDGQAKKAMDFDVVKKHLAKMTPAEREALKKAPNYFYEVTFEKPGGLVMPIIVEIEYEDGSKERQTYPAQIWMKNDKEVKKVYRTSQKIKSIKIDPNLETADVDTSNNSWPKKKDSKFNKFKNKVKG